MAVLALPVMSAPSILKVDASCTTVLLVLTATAAPPHELLPALSWNAVRTTLAVAPLSRRSAPPKPPAPLSRKTPQRGCAETPPPTCAGRQAGSSSYNGRITSSAPSSSNTPPPSLSALLPTTTVLISSPCVDAPVA